MEQLLSEIRNCTICKEYLPLGPRPVVTGSQESKIVIIGQAPGLKVHQSGIPWDDQSGKKLREWLGVDDETFYDTTNFAIVPMGFCYPGKAKTGDAPPRKECAPLWHDRIFSEMKKVQLVLLVGSYATHQYLQNSHGNLTEKVGEYKTFLPAYWPIPHPSPTNRFWRAKNPWFEESIVPELQEKVKEILARS